MEYSNVYAKKFSDSYFGKDVKGLAELHADGTYPKTGGYRKVGTSLLKNTGAKVNGIAEFVKGVGTMFI